MELVRYRYLSTGPVSAHAAQGQSLSTPLPTELPPLAPSPSPKGKVKRRKPLSLHSATPGSVQEEDPRRQQKHHPNHCQGIISTGGRRTGRGLCPKYSPAGLSPSPAPEPGRAAQPRLLSRLLRSRARARRCNRLAVLGSSWQKIRGARLPPLPCSGAGTPGLPTARHWEVAAVAGAEQDTVWLQNKTNPSKHRDPPCT